MISEERKIRWTRRISYCRNRLYKLNDWEMVFIDSINTRYCVFGKELTLKQSYKLNKIFDKLQGE